MTSRKGQSDDNSNIVEHQALEEAEMIAKLAPNEKTRKEAKGVVEKITETIEETSTPSSFPDEERHELDEVLDETKRIIKKTTNEAKREIPRYTKALGELQQQTIQTTKEIGYDCIELQREATSLIPYLEQMYMSFYAPWLSPRVMTEYYTRMVDNFVDNALAATNLANNLAVVNMESIQQMSDTNREYCRVGVDTVRSLKESLTQ
jgi:hypothetical protein